MVGFCSTFGAKYFGGYAKNCKNGDSRYAIKNLLKQRNNLKNINFQHKDFREIKNISGYVIYCDPPYKDTTKYSTKNFPYEEFYNWCEEMSKNNIVLISEYNMPDNFKCIWQKESKVTFDSNRKVSDKKNKRIEKLFKA